jgi:GNAT superfamily N-acetyltransferase
MIELSAPALAPVGMSIMIDTLIADAERIEAESMLLYVASAPPAVSARLGITTARIGGGVALAMVNDTTGFWNRAQGLGLTEPVTAAILDELIAFFRSAGTGRTMIQIAPSLLPPDWAGLAAERGLEPGREWMKLSAPVESLRPAATDLRIGPVGPQELATWAKVWVDGFEMPEPGLAEMVFAAAGNPAFHPYAAWDGETMVGVANLFVYGENALFNAATTLPGHRGRGVQSALISARGRVAAEAGCRRVFAETGVPDVEGTNPSLNNMHRAGLQDLYARRNWIWR